MSAAPCSFTEARDAFLKALSDYQTATRDMSVALQRVTGHTHAFYESLTDVVNTSGSMLAPPRRS